jgi:hypothetical protein
MLPLNSPRPTIDQALAAAGAATDNCPGTVSVQVTDGGPVLLPGCIMTETFTLTATDECGNKTVCNVTFTWDILLEQPVIQGSSSVCAGTPGVVYSTTPGMASYFWSVSAGGMITAGLGTSAITVTWLTPGPQTVSVNYIDNNGCTAASPTIFHVTVCPLPTITLTGPSPACNYSTGNVYVTEPGMTNYTWTIPSGAVVTGGGTGSSNSVTITWTTPGTKILKVNYTNPCGCRAVSPKQLTISVLTAPKPVITGTSTPCLFASTTYSTSPWQKNYNWTISPDGEIISGQFTNAVKVKWNATGPQWIGVNFSISNGCSAPSPTIKNVNVIYPCTKESPEGVTNPESTINALITGAENVIIYPNPNDGTFTADISVTDAAEYDLQIYSNLGSKVYELRDLFLSGKLSKKIDLGDLAPGVYNFILSGKEHLVQKRFIIQR